jgi:hypothetical protein
MAMRPVSMAAFSMTLQCPGLLKPLSAGLEKPVDVACRLTKSVVFGVNTSKEIACGKLMPSKTRQNCK